MNAKKAEPAIPREVIESYDRLIATQPGVDRKGAKIPYTSRNGHMYSYVAEPGSLALRLAPPERATNAAAFGRASIEVRNGNVDGIHIVIHQGMDVRGRITVDGMPSLAYVSSLKPKPTRRG